MRPFAAIAVVLAASLVAHAQGEGERKGRKPKEDGGDGKSVFLSTIPDYQGNVILARPTDHSVTLNVMMNAAARVQVVYGVQGKADQRTEAFDLKAGEPKEIVLEKLPADSACRYRLVSADSHAEPLPDSLSGEFRTRRPPGAAFTFTVQADSHMDGGCVPALYELTLANALACRPDFHIDLGDTFMTGKIATRDEAAKQYRAQRYWFGLIGRSAPVFLTIGNHDGEETNRPGATDADGLAVWSCGMRKKYFSNPEPDTFYSGNDKPNPNAGPLQDYYAWEWGDALFAVLDPYWYSGPNRGGSSPWSATLGKAQYDWLARTLRGSQAKYKFVFIHQLVGGVGKDGRCGTEAAPLYEWGGHETDGTDTFAAHRPGWKQPIHSLLVETGVRIVFHGHDHFFARQELDGIVYQLVPQPGHRNLKSDHAEEYGYVKGDFLPSSGFLSVKVSPESVTVAYIRSALQDAEGRGIRNGEAAFSYTVRPR